MGVCQPLIESMSYLLQIAESESFGPAKFVNKAGHTECVEFVRQATGAPSTPEWRQGAPVVGTQPGNIRRGTAIATFDEHGHYPRDGRGRHAAIFLEENALGIVVLDQWNSQGEVKRRTIYLKRPDYPRVDCARQYFVIE